MTAESSCVVGTMEARNQSRKVTEWAWSPGGPILRSICLEGDMGDNMIRESSVEIKWRLRRPWRSDSMESLIGEVKQSKSILPAGWGAMIGPSQASHTSSLLSLLALMTLPGEKMRLMWLCGRSKIQNDHRWQTQSADRFVTQILICTKVMVRISSQKQTALFMIVFTGCPRTLWAFHSKRPIVSLYENGMPRGFCPSIPGITTGSLEDASVRSVVARVAFDDHLTC